MHVTESAQTVLAEYSLVEVCSDSKAGKEAYEYGVCLKVNGVKQMVFDNVHPEREAVKRLVEYLNREKVEPIHFEFVLDDWLQLVIFESVVL